jgi:hypothetical protein
MMPRHSRLRPPRDALAEAVAWRPAPTVAGDDAEGDAPWSAPPPWPRRPPPSATPPG